MSELYKHLLIPEDIEFVPELNKIAAFFCELDALGTLPKNPRSCAKVNLSDT
jgi:hypothetical protein